MINPGIFKAYDIRGIYNKDLNSDTAIRIGRAFGSYIGKGKRVAIGMDVRISSQGLRDQALKGILEQGVNVLDLGMVPTPLLYFAILNYKLDGGFMVTASHNPPEWNGFKLYGEMGRAIGLGFGLEKIMKLCEHSYVSKSTGNLENKRDDAVASYKKFLLSKIKIRNEVRMAIDPGNGCFSNLAYDILNHAGADVIAINDIPDGKFPSRSPEPKEETISQLRNLVKNEGLDFGVAFDSDGDRAVFVDEYGSVLAGDAALAILLKGYLKKGDKVVYEVSCSGAVEDVIKEAGAKPLLSRVGRSFIADRMVKEGAVMGGERSGHMFFSEINMADDALFAGLKMAELLSSKQEGLSGLVAQLPKYENAAKELKLEEKIKFRIVEILKKSLAEKEKNLITIDGIKVVRDDGWFLLRASNTSPIIRLTAESKTRRGLDQLMLFAVEEFEKAKSEAER